MVESGAALYGCFLTGDSLGLLVHGQSIHQPGAVHLLAVYGDGLCDALVVVHDTGAVVDAAEVLYQQVEGGSLGDVDIEIEVFGDAVEHAYTLAVHVDGGIVGQSRNAHRAFESPGGAESVEHVALALIEVLHGEQSLALYGFRHGEHGEHIGTLTEFDGRDGDDGDALWHLGHVVDVLHHERPQGTILRSGPACFADGRVVVVARQVGLDVAGVGEVGSRGESEVGATVDDVDVEAHAGVEIGLGDLHQVVDAGRHEGFVPVVKPSGIEFRNEVGAHAVVIFVDLLLQVGYVVFAVGAGEHALDVATVKEPVAVGCEGRCVEALFPKHVVHGVAVLLVHLFADVLALSHIGAEFILRLYHEYGSAVGYLQILHLTCQLLVVHAAGVEERLVQGSHFESLHLLQPPGEATVVPLCAHIGTRTEYHVKSFFLSLADELPKVMVPGSPVPNTGSHLMVVPHHVSGHRVHAHRLNHFQAVAPVGCRDTCVVDFATVYLQRFSIVEELASADVEGVAGCLCFDTGNRHQKHEA